MTDLLISAARRMGIETDISAGPGQGLPGTQIWARWPRHRLEIAQEILNRVTSRHENAKVMPLGATPLWRARYGAWTYIGRFEDAVAHLALHVADEEAEATEPPRQSAPTRYAARQ